MKEIQIGQKTVGLNQQPYFIADVAANHDGDIHRAFKLIELAKEAGADAAKLQNFKANTIVSKNGFEKMGGQLSHQATWKKSVFEVYQDASIPDDWTALLKTKCDEVGIEYMTSPYDYASVDHAASYLNAYKIGSGDITWTQIIEYIACKGKPVILATGASSMEDVKRAVESIQKNDSELILMQCNTNYTADPENFKYINLTVLKEYGKMFPDAVLGLSDHTIGYATVLGAIAYGARVIEKHFTDDKTRSGPDHKFSTLPDEWKEMVRASNELFYALGDGIKKIENNEKETAVVQRRALYYCTDLQKGHKIIEQDLIALRPIKPDELPPYKEKQLLGRKLVKNVQADCPVHEEDFEC